MQGAYDNKFSSISKTISEKKTFKQGTYYLHITCNTGSNGWFYLSSGTVDYSP
jgi:hypothetical protein